MLRRGSFVVALWAAACAACGAEGEVASVDLLLARLEEGSSCLPSSVTATAYRTWMISSSTGPAITWYWGATCAVDRPDGAVSAVTGAWIADPEGPDGAVPPSSFAGVSVHNRTHHMALSPADEPQAPDDIRYSRLTSVFVTPPTGAGYFASLTPTSAELVERIRRSSVTLTQGEPWSGAGPDGKPLTTPVTSLHLVDPAEPETEVRLDFMAGPSPVVLRVVSRAVREPQAPRGARRAEVSLATHLGSAAGRAYPSRWTTTSYDADEAWAPLCVWSARVDLCRIWERHPLVLRALPTPDLPWPPSETTDLDALREQLAGLRDAAWEDACRPLVEELVGADCPSRLGEVTE